MRVVSLVPSWTETLLAAQVNVVGRTRYCIHPAGQIEAIPILGGTKDLDLEKLAQINPDLLLLDQEENPKWLSEKSPCAWHATHVSSAFDLPRELQALSEKIKSPPLALFGQQWAHVMQKPLPAWTASRPLPGVLEWGRSPESEIEKVVYMIWKKPWMAVSRSTFIGSVLEFCGFGPLMIDFDSKYPTVDLQQFDPKKTLLLFSSEPFPFLKQKAILHQEWSGAYAFVDGECYSWFGVRALEFLKSQTPSA